MLGAMWLLDKMLRQIVRKGELTVVDHDGKEYRYGAPDPYHAPVKVRLTDARAAFDIATNPRLGTGEAYMDGRLVPIRGDIRDFLLFFHYNAPFESPFHALNPKGPLRRAVNHLAGRIDQINWKTRSRRNAEHTYNLTRRLYELFLDTDRQYTMAYYRDPSHSLRPSSTRRRISPPSFT
jgi:cyclopropane-fatty-acyl-phospholipid synthase